MTHGWKHFTLRLFGLVAFFLGGMLFFAITVNALIFFGLMPDPVPGAPAFGYTLASLTVYVSMGMALIGFSGIFIKPSWGIVFYTAPLYGPSLFALVYTLMNGNAGMGAETIPLE